VQSAPRHAGLENRAGDGSSLYSSQKRLACLSRLAQSPTALHDAVA
jgi:hypothetical protein